MVNPIIFCIFGDFLTLIVYTPMKIIDKIKNATSPLFTFELLPPLKGHTLESLYQNIERLMEFNPAYINMTFHQPESAFIEQPDGTFVKKTLSKRPGTVAISAAIQSKFNVPVVPHIICGGLTKEATENILIDLHFLGIKNILALRGDAPKGEKRFAPEKGGNANASDLVQQIVHLNNGKYLDGEQSNNTPTDFCIGVAGYPEKHIEAPNMDIDLQHLKNKVDLGADYIVTQMFFDNKKYVEFVKKCREIGITVPIIPGIKPISMLNDLKLIPQIFSLDIPDELVKEITKCKDNKEARDAGTAWAIAQSKELLTLGAPSIHYYTYGNSSNVQEIAKAVF